MAEHILHSSQPAAPPRAKRSRGRADDRAADPRLPDEPNPFLLDDEEYLPKVPDTRDWHYFWMRVQKGDKGDGQNIVRKMRSKWQYEYVRPSEMPDFAPNAGRHEKIDGDVIQFNDVVLVKCPRIRYVQYMQAHQSRVAAMRGQSIREARERFGDHIYSSDTRDTETRMNDTISAAPGEFGDEFAP